ncbi:MAG: NTP transferase domain-containing protein [Pseudomonadota bacterium]
MRWQALILAGSRGPSDPVAEAAGVSHKAFADLAGRPMIVHVIDALRGVEEIGDIAVSVETDAPALPGNVRRLNAADSPARSVLAGFEHLGPPLLVTTADNPLLTPAMLRDFLAGAARSNTDAVAAVAPRDVVEQAGNPGKRTYLHFSDGAFSGCNLFAFPTREGSNAIAFWQRLEADRKKPWRMAWQVGPGPLLAYAAGRLSTAGIAAAIGKRAGCRAALVPLAHPDAAHDVDKAADLDFVRRRLAKREAG